jgi:UDPglucose 6-dehydrogenase
VKVGIIGNGYVGKGMERLFAGVYEIGRYDPVHNPDETNLCGSDLVLICTPTPPNEDGSCDISAIFDAADRATKLCPDALVCIKSAVPPGTTDQLNAHYSGRRFHVSPEYMGELPNFTPPWDYPDPRDARSHDFVIVGGPRAGEVLDFFQRVMATTARYMACSCLEAELVKRLENAFFATKVTFCNEAARIVSALGAEWHRVRELWLLDPRIGRSHTAVFPDRPGFGGKCLPKDLSALIHEAEAAGADTSLLRSIRETNERIRSHG